MCPYGTMLNRTQKIRITNFNFSNLKSNQNINERNFWEKKPLHIERNDPNYYKSWFSCQEFDFIMKNVFNKQNKID